MYHLKPFLLILLLPTLAFGQSQRVDIYGTMSGDFNGKLYLFFEGNYRQKDSISSEIVNGSFHISATVALPVQARFHLGRHSFIQDVYIDSDTTYLTCSNKLEIYGKDKDTLNMFTVLDVAGSQTESLKRNFENGLATLKGSNLSEEEKNQEYYDRLHNFVSNHRQRKLSLYLLGKASSLRYAQVYELSTLVDSTMKSSYEWKAIPKLLNSLDKSKNKAIGAAFLDVTLKDSLGTSFNTKDLRGKFVLVDFWASWCKPCREAHPALNSLYSRWKARDFEILGVSFDKEADSWKKAIVKDGLLWKQVIDEEGVYGELGKHYDIDAIPQSLLLDREGRIIGVGLSVAEVEEAINRRVL